MIASIAGTIQKIEDNALIINVGGLGLRVAVPSSVLENTPGVGRDIMLFTHFIVKETEMALYGFQTEDDQKLFELVLSVNGVGPKVGLAILSSLSPEILKNAIMREEPAVLQRVPGIGKKTAERILFQLRDKLDFNTDAPNVPFVSDIDTDVIDILTSLGFSIVQAQSALQGLPREVTDLDERVALALKSLDES